MISSIAASDIFRSFRNSMSPISASSAGLSAPISIGIAKPAPCRDGLRAKERVPIVPTDVKLIADGLVYREWFPIRSYEVGPDRTVSITTLLGYLLETMLTQMKCIVGYDIGFGQTPEMSKRNLIWVVTNMQVLIEHYPSWRDVIEVAISIGASKKNAIRREWHIRNCQTNQTILRASSTWVMMNKETRRLSKLPEEVKAELEPYFTELVPVIHNDMEYKLDDEDSIDHVCRDLTPRWDDLDCNEHVNNVKYMRWILESIPISIQESHEISSMTLEYKRECRRDDVVDSLTTVSRDRFAGPTQLRPVEYRHLLRSQGGSKVVRGRTEWRPKTKNRA